MLLITEIQGWFLLLACLSSFVLASWTLFVIIPNRNATVRFLEDRNKTLEFWIHDLNKDFSDDDMSGSELEKRRAAMLKIYADLNEQLRKCLIQIEYFNDAIKKQNDLSHEQP